MTVSVGNIKTDACSLCVYTKSDGRGVKMAHGSSNMWGDITEARAQFGLSVGEALGWWDHFNSRLRRSDSFIDHIRASRNSQASALLDLTPALTSAEAFRVAIAALPVGRDIRARLLAHLDAHVSSIHQLGAAK